MYVMLPLYSYQQGKKVMPKSGLNQGYAHGRPRDLNEVYIPIPKIFYRHPNSNGFFPAPTTSFTLILPNGNSLSAKICQENDKALMSNPNRDLGQWLLNDVLNITHNGPVTYNDLSNCGYDSVKITKIDNTTFKIEPASIDSFEDFVEGL